jgi:hypothetical protein
MLQGQAAARPHLRFVPGRDFDRQSGRHQAGGAGFEEYIFYRVQIHSGILAGSVSVAGQDGLRVGSLDSDLHSPLS